MFSLVLKYLWLSRSYLGFRKFVAFQDQKFRNKDYQSWRGVSAGLLDLIEDPGLFPALHGESQLHTAQFRVLTSFGTTDSFIYMVAHEHTKVYSRINKHNKSFFLKCVYVCVGGLRITLELVWFSPSTFIRGSEDQIQVIRLPNKVFLPTESFHWLRI